MSLYEKAKAHPDFSIKPHYFDFIMHNGSPSSFFGPKESGDKILAELVFAVMFTTQKFTMYESYLYMKTLYALY